MIGLGKVTYYNADGTTDWLRTIVRTVYYYADHDASYVMSVAAKRAQKLYYRKTDIRTILGLGGKL